MIRPFMINSPVGTWDAGAAYNVWAAVRSLRVIHVVGQVALARLDGLFVGSSVTG